MIKILKIIYFNLRLMVNRIRFFFSINWIKTLYFNFKMFPFEIAKQLPVYFYGKVKFSNLKGKISIEAPIKRGMIGFGQKFERMSVSKGISELFLAGELVFKGHAHIGKDFFFCVDKDAYCEFGFMGCLGSDVKLVCSKEIILGNWAGIGYESQIIDTNSHPMMNTETGEYYPMKNKIKIGNHNSFSNRISIMGNTKTPDHCVVASNSICNKDYTSLGSYILIGGQPAKLIKNNYARDWESEKERLKKHKRVKE
ncbi:acyltransferase [Meridianimaribacter flavus]|uniref:Acetyltransferase-like isoleucine patch superfamily enzyme n=1 Tax=Meridianimaribacter flavus TaxID=571115 RepID=A0ABY2G8U5_9FLAO|nr:transferase [Meridianimaribacter flavus]TDY14225.1 acetyltransferase-like isoleucine patch superfamily enzyme [Meridianimaribacter flavus]